MSKIVTLCNQKGGVSKTSTAHLLALGLKNTGLKVLLVDLDPQTNLTFIGGAYNEAPTLKEVFTGEVSTEEAIFKGASVDIIPGSAELAGDDLNGDYTLLKEALEPIKRKYDLIVIDSPPGLGILTTNALVASNSVLVPCGADILSIQGFSQLYDEIKAVKDNVNKNLKISGLLITRYDNRTGISKRFTSELESITKRLKLYLYNAKIREGVAIKRYQADELDPFKDKKSGVIQDYLQLIDEFKEREGL